VCIYKKVQLQSIWDKKCGAIGKILGNQPLVNLMGTSWEHIERKKKKKKRKKSQAGDLKINMQFTS
jgi:hypothetical protein